MTAECNHTTQFTTLDGRVLCELCAQKAAGWKECRTPGCLVGVPPDVKWCDTHQTGWAECGTCAGDGGIDCEEDDCHGQYCDEGIVECPDCGSQGVVAVAV